uniref:Neurotensin/neuromedin N n=1 Tax=Scleropages formosus TaxID=113540 RepID=A0A8C9WML9_SCLFO
MYHLPKDRCRPCTPLHGNSIARWQWLCHIAKIVEEWFEEHDKEFKVRKTPYILKRQLYNTKARRPYILKRSPGYLAS